MAIPERRFIILRPTDRSQIEFHEGPGNGVTVIWLDSEPELPDASGRRRTLYQLDPTMTDQLRRFLRAITE